MKWPFSKPAAVAEPQPVGGGRTSIAGVSGLVRALPDPVLVLDRSGTVVVANAALRAAVEGEPENQNIAVAIRAPAVLDAINGAIADGNPRTAAFEQRGPIVRHFDVHVAPFDTAEGRAVLVQLRDLTREQQVERLRADFVANASHELRTPLAAISGFIETLQGAARNDAKAQERFLGMMRVQAARMKRLIDDLLSLSRIELNEHQRPTAAADLGQAARQAADSLQAMATTAGCDIRLDLADGLIVMGDRDELVQVVQNLLENALKYASVGRRVEVEGRREGSEAVLAVRDHGPGIAEEHLPRLTERFYRVSVQDSRSRGGTGLGLAIVKHILNRHRGRLSISSEIGKGTCFAVRMPIKNL